MLLEWLDMVLARHDDKPVIVWYDPGGTLETLANRAAEHRKRLVFEGSYLALRFALEAEDPSFEGKWLIYIPEAAPEQSWLREWELFGARLNLDFLTLLGAAAGLPVDQELRSLLAGDHAGNARRLAANWDTVMGRQPVTKENLVRALLALCFGQPSFDLRETVLSFVVDPGQTGRLEQMGLYSLWRQWLVSDWGLPDLPQDPASLRERLVAVVLLTELVQESGQLADVFSGLLPAPRGRAAVASITAAWRANYELQAAYADSAARVERAYSLQERLQVDDRLPAVPTFLAVDHLLIREVELAAGEGGAGFAAHREQFQRLAGQRRQFFWAQRGLAPWWEPLYLAACLHQAGEAALSRLPQLGSVEQLVEAYAAREGWWQIDHLAMKLAAASTTLTSSEQRERFVAPAWRVYQEFLDRSAKRLAELVAAGGWQPTQHKFWQDLVSRVSGCHAVLFIDALRLDLARHLEQDLERTGEFTAELSWLQGVLPGITEAGMASLLPGAEQGLRSAVADGRLKFCLEQTDVTGAERRRAWLRNVLGRDTHVCDLAEAEEMRRWPAHVSRLVVLWDGIDDFGTFTADLSSNTFFDLTKRLERLLLHLRRLGCVRIILAADHGFLFLPTEAGTPARIPVSAGEGVVCKHRFAAGRISETLGTREFAARDLGWQGGVPFAFPEGLAIFGLPGETSAFLHGGISLQETVLPVLILNASVTGKVRVTMELPERISAATVRIRLRSHREGLFDSSRRVTVEILAPGLHKVSNVVEIGPETQETSISLIWLTGLSLGETAPQRLTVKLIDADTREILEQREVPVALLFS